MPDKPDKSTDTGFPVYQDPNPSDSGLSRRLTDKPEYQQKATEAALAVAGTAMGNVSALSGAAKVWMTVGATGFMTITFALLLFFYSQTQQTNYSQVVDMVRATLDQHRSDALSFREELKIGREHDAQMRNVTHQLIRDNQRVLESVAKTLEAMQRGIDTSNRMLRKLNKLPDADDGQGAVVPAFPELFPFVFKKPRGMGWIW